MTVGELTVPRSDADRRWLTARRARAIGWGLFVVGLPLRAVALWLSARMVPEDVGFSFGLGFWAFVAAVALGLSCALVGAVIVSRLPTNALGWLYVLVGATQAVMTAILGYAVIALPAGQDQPSLLFLWLNGLADFALPLAGVALALALFPSGWFLPRWEWVGALAIAGGLIRTLEIGFGSPILALMTSDPNPYRLAGPLGELLAASERLNLGLVILGAAAVGGAASLVVRYRHAGLEGRRQIRWLLFSGFLIILCSLPFAYSQFVPDARELGFDSLALAFTSASLGPIATLVAITRYRLYEIDRIVNRTVVYGSLTAILAGVFTAGIGLAQRLFVLITGESSDAAIVLATLVVATLYAPLRRRLEAFVDRRFKFDDARFGQYRDELTRHLALTDPERASRRLAEESLRELGAAGAAVVDAAGRVVASAGEWPMPSVMQIPVGAGPDAATLLIGARADGREFDARGVVALTDVAGLAGAAMRS